MPLLLHEGRWVTGGGVGACAAIGFDGAAGWLRSSGSPGAGGALDKLCMKRFKLAFWSLSLAFNDRPAGCHCRSRTPGWRRCAG